MSDGQKKYWTDDPDLVEKYVLGQLSEEEHKRFDAEIAECEPCKEKLRREMHLAAGIRRLGRDQLKSRLRLKLRRKQSQQVFRYQSIGLAAAVVVIAVGVGVYQLWFSDLEAPKNFNNKEIVLKQPEPAGEASGPREEQAGRGTKDEGKLEKRAIGGKAVDQDAIASSQGSAVRKDKGPARAKQGFAITEGDVSDVAESAAPVKSKKNIPTRSIWLIGKVVLVEDQKPAALSDTLPQAFMSEQSRVRGEQSAEQRSRRINIKRGETEEQIVLQQRSFRELPRSRQTQIGRKNLVETLVQQSEEGLSLTIYSDSITAEEMESASVETSGNDSLIIATSSQRIYYRLPAAFQQQTRTRR